MNRIFEPIRCLAWETYPNQTRHLHSILFLSLEDYKGKINVRSDARLGKGLFFAIFETKNL